MNLLKEDTKDKQKSALADLLAPPQPKAAAPEPPAPKMKDPVAKPKRCMGLDCSKKLGLTDFACKCNGWFCSAHRYAEAHSCTHDFKSSGQDLLKGQLVKVAAEKVEKL